MTLVFIILDMNIKKVTECNVINSVNPLYLRILDIKGQFIYFVYYNWSLIKNNVSCIKFNTSKETKIW